MPNHLERPSWNRGYAARADECADWCAPLWRSRLLWAPCLGATGRTAQQLIGPGLVHDYLDRGVIWSPTGVNADVSGDNQGFFTATLPAGHPLTFTNATTDDQRFTLFLWIGGFTTTSNSGYSLRMTHGNVAMNVRWSISGSNRRIRWQTRSGDVYTDYLPIANSYAIAASFDYPNDKKRVWVNGKLVADAASGVYQAAAASVLAVAGSTSPTSAYYNSPGEVRLLNIVEGVPPDSVLRRATLDPIAPLRRDTSLSLAVLSNLGGGGEPPASTSWLYAQRNATIIGGGTA